MYCATIAVLNSIKLKSLLKIILIHKFSFSNSMEKLTKGKLNDNYVLPLGAREVRQRDSS